jgi:hypothetical protein
MQHMEFANNRIKQIVFKYFQRYFQIYPNIFTDGQYGVSTF